MMNTAIQHITFADLQRWRAEHRPFQLVDVREPEEHEAFNIGGTLIPLSEIVKKRSQINASLPVVIYCKRGIRSQIAIQKLSALLPETDFYNLQNGIFHLKNNQLSE